MNTQRNQRIRAAAGASRLALIMGVVAALVVGAVAFVLVDRDDAATLVYEPASAVGADPFTESVVNDEGVAASPSPTDAAESGQASLEPVSVSGDTPALYGGSGRNDACDVGALIGFLTENEDKGRAWAEVQGIPFAELADYLQSLTPLVLTRATLVTNHGFSDGKATPRQSVLEAGTAVLVDDRGVPRARCACGNPLLEPEHVPTDIDVDTDGHLTVVDEVVAVDPSPAPIGTIVIECPNGAPVDEATLPTGASELYIGRYDEVLDRSPLQNIRNVVRVTIFTDSEIAGFASNQDYAPVGDLGNEQLRIHVHGNGFSSAGTELSWSGLSEPNTAPFDDAPDSSDGATVTATLDEATGTVTGTVVHADGTTQTFTASLAATIPGLGEGEDDTDGAPGVPTLCVEVDADEEVPPDSVEVPAETTDLTGEFTAFPGELPGALTQNQITLTLGLDDGVVSGESVWAFSGPGDGVFTHAYTWSGTFDPATNQASGEVTVTLTSFDGSVVSSGTGTWSATFDPETGMMTGTVVIDDQVLEFSASTAG